MSRRVCFFMACIFVFALCCIVIIVFPREFIPPYTYDDSVVTGIPCSLPCWHDLVVGESNYEDVRQFLLQSSFVPNELINMDDTSISWSWRNMYHRGEFVFDDNDVLTSMRIKPNFKFLVSSVFEFIGEPEAVQGYFSIGGRNHQSIIELVLYYPNVGVVIHTSFDIDDFDNIVIPQELRGDSFEVYQPSNNLTSFISKVRPSWQGESHQLLYDFVLGWPGFDSTVTIPSDSIAPLNYSTPTPE